MAGVTLQTIAERLGVSRMTVSNAFSTLTSSSTISVQRILATAAELGYVGPDPTARALARGTTGAIGVLLTDSLRYAFTDDVATSFLGAVVDELSHTGMALTLLPTDGDDNLIPARDVGIDGALCIPASAVPSLGSGLSGASCHWCSLIRIRRRGSRASTSTTAAVLGPRRSISSSSGTLASASWDSRSISRTRMPARTRRRVAGASTGHQQPDAWWRRGGVLLDDRLLRPPTP